MEAFDVIQIIDRLKIEHNANNLQDKLNMWKAFVIRTDMNSTWNFENFEKELKEELLIIQSILTEIKK